MRLPQYKIPNRVLKLYLQDFNLQFYQGSNINYQIYQILHYCRITTNLLMLKLKRILEQNSK